MRRLAKFATAVLSVTVLLLAGGCASIDLDQDNTALSAPPSTERVLKPSDPALTGKQIITLRQPATRTAFDFNAALISSTASHNPAADSATAAHTENNLYDVVSVYWGTDRKFAQTQTPVAVNTGDITTGSISRVKAPGGERGSKLTLGRAHVTIPRVAREKGDIIRPWQITFLKYTLYRETEDPRKHFTVGKLERFDEKDFITASNRHMNGASRFKDQAFIFIHGFNTTFEDALYRTAQIAYDLEFDGVPYMYSWPSKGEKRAYLYDRDSADRARRYFREFIELVASKTKAKRIHIITHSLGTRPTVEALQQIAAAPGGTKNLKLGQIILAAPDIDRDVFKDIAGVITKAGHGTTLYAADNDRPLQLSRILARGKPRAGEITDRAGPMIVKDVDTIDISDAGTDAFLSLHHATYADNTHVLADIRLLLKQGVHPPDKRFPIYQRKKIAAGTYWKYVKN